MVEADVVEEPVERVTRKEVVEAIKKIKRGQASGLAEIIMASGKIGQDVMMQLCQRILDGNGIPDEWKTSMVVPIFKEKGDVMHCGPYRGVKLLKHGMKIAGEEDTITGNLDVTQFGFMPGKGTMDALFIVRRMQEEFQAKEKRKYMCFVDLEKAFDIVPRRVMEWAMMK